MRRREFLCEAAAVLAAGGLLAGCEGGARGALRRDAGARAAARRAGEVVGRAAAIEIGALVDAQSRAAPSPSRVAGAIALLDDAPGRAHRVEAAVREDFLAGRVHDLHGWMFSQSELEICLLVYLAG